MKDFEEFPGLTQEDIEKIQERVEQKLKQSSEEDGEEINIVTYTTLYNQVFTYELLRKYHQWIYSEE